MNHKNASFIFLNYQSCGRPPGRAEGVAIAPPPPRTPGIDGAAILGFSPLKGCDVTGHIASNLRFEGAGVPNQREVIERAYVLDAADRSLVKEVRVGRREKQARDMRTGRDYLARSYEVPGLPTNRRYIALLSNAWRTDPAEVAFDCPNSRGQYSFEIPTLYHTGNRFGG